MALYITYEDGEELIWHVGQSTPDGCQRVKRIQANGEELNYIKHHYKIVHNSFVTSYTIPMSNHNLIVIWVGDIAKTIVANL